MADTDERGARRRLAGAEVGAASGASAPIEVSEGLRQRRLIRHPRDWIGFLPGTGRTDPISRMAYHKAFLRYHDPENWPILSDILREMGREDLIGPKPDQLVPAHQPAGTGGNVGTSRPVRRLGGGGQRFKTKGVPMGWK